MLFDSNKLLLIAGPCSLENEGVCRAVADTLVQLRRTHAELNIVFKGSFDKANRTSLAGARGTGIDEGLALLAMVKRDYGFPVLTDVHESAQVGPVAAMCDVIQIPAFLCRQTDLLEAAGATGKPVNVKKGQWMHPEGLMGAVAKVRGAFQAAVEGGAITGDTALEGTADVAVTERGTFFGYGDLVVDMRSFARMRAACDAPVIFDATHSVQQPGRGEGGSSGGAREYIPALAQAACAAGADGLFMETHPDPAHAPSDGPNMMPLDQLDALILRCVEMWQLARS